MKRVSLFLCLALLSRGAHAAEAEAGSNSTSPQAAPQSALPSADQNNALDAAYGAYQRGYYLTAMQEAEKRLKADPKDAFAMTLLGELYNQGIGVKLDLVQAAHWYKLAADLGNREAIFALALAKLQGRGVPKDIGGARALFQKAAAMNHSGALYNLGVMAAGSEPPDFADATIYFRQSASLGYPDAAYSLALCYRYGRGVIKDDKQAADWMKRAADAEHVPAEVEYAIMLFNGIGVAKDEAAAAKLFLKAAYRENPVAQDRVARLLAAGRGIQKDVVQAMKWHLIAQTKGEKDAWLDGLLNNLSPAQKVEVEEAVRHYSGN